MKMKNKIITAFFALAIVVSAFFVPMTAYAAGDSQEPTVTAEFIDELLHIEASDNDSGVESIFINEQRFNYRVDGALIVDVKDNHGNEAYINIYAVDFAGNKSDAVQIKNPYYTSSDNSGPIIAPPSDSTEGVSSEQAPFTPDGTGTVTDNIIQQNGKEFFTITTEDGNVFYLVIDRQRDSENVYLLNAVTEDDLAALAENGGSGSSQNAIPIPTTPEPTEPTEPTPTPEPEPESPAKSNTGSMIFIIIAALAAGGAGYYFKILKPKQDAAAQVDDDLFGEDMEYEDDPDDEEYEETEDESDYEEYPYEPEESESEETE